MKVKKAFKKLAKIETGAAERRLFVTVHGSQV
jgi:hypothetical protein